MTDNIYKSVAEDMLKATLMGEGDTFCLDMLEKGKRAQIGETRTWRGGTYRKTASGWEKVRDGGGKGAAADAPKEEPKKEAPKKEEPEKKTGGRDMSEDAVKGRLLDKLTAWDTDFTKPWKATININQKGSEIFEDGMIDYDGEEGIAEYENGKEMKDLIKDLPTLMDLGVKVIVNKGGRRGARPYEINKKNFKTFFHPFRDKL